LYRKNPNGKARTSTDVDFVNRKQKRNIMITDLDSISLIAIQKEQSVNLLNIANTLYQKAATMDQKTNSASLREESEACWKMTDRGRTKIIAIQIY
jgi:regulator of extracellular matrix RemA (YlzA/DUF370 family)